MEKPSRASLIKKVAKLEKSLLEANEFCNELNNSNGDYYTEVEGLKNYIRRLTYDVQKAFKESVEEGTWSICRNSGLYSTLFRHIEIPTEFRGEYEEQEYLKEQKKVTPFDKYSIYSRFSFSFNYIFCKRCSVKTFFGQERRRNKDAHWRYWDGEQAKLKNFGGEKRLVKSESNKKTTKGWVYFLRVGNHVKVGMSSLTNPFKRLSTYITESPHKTTLVGLLESFNHTNLESGIHSLLTQKGYHLHHEWFEISDRELYEQINRSFTRGFTELDELGRLKTPMRYDPRYFGDDEINLKWFVEKNEVIFMLPYTYAFFNARKIEDCPQKRDTIS